MPGKRRESRIDESGLTRVGRRQHPRHSMNETEETSRHGRASRPDWILIRGPSRVGLSLSLDDFSVRASRACVVPRFNGTFANSTREAENQTPPRHRRKVDSVLMRLDSRAEDSPGAYIKLKRARVQSDRPVLPARGEREERVSHRARPLSSRRLYFGQRTFSV